MNYYGAKAMKKVCMSYKLCIRALTLCTKKGFIPLEYTKHQIAWSLQNPYAILVPKSAVSVRVLKFFNKILIRIMEEIQLV